jgi:hypothetical protein
MDVSELVNLHTEDVDRQEVMSDAGVAEDISEPEESKSASDDDEDEYDEYDEDNDDDDDDEQSWVDDEDSHSWDEESEWWDNESEAQQYPKLPSLVPLIATWNPQADCPLFCMLPSELRQHVLLLALLPYQDTSAPGVPFDSAGYRPETAFPVIQNVALLRTCRRIYLETHALPASLRTFVSWKLVWNQRSPYGRATGPRFVCLTEDAMLHANDLHIYAQQCGLEGGGWARRATKTGADPLPSIRRLTITIRHTDFWSWENDAPLRLDANCDYGEDWRRDLDHFPNLEELIFELETLERRKTEMNKIAEQVKRWKIVLKDGRILSTDGQPVQHHTWMGSSQYHGAEQPPADATQLPYYVATIRWKAPRAAAL